MTGAVEQLSPDAVAGSLRAHLAVSDGRVIVDRIDDLSPWIGSSRVFRVTFSTAGRQVTEVATSILKVPD